jgi:NAD(P)-dependent dehydrogenase (short-subunit alcohol dehydrogenase family)
MTASPGEGRFAGRVGLVTGAAQGMGRAIAVRLLAEGARVVLFDRNRAALEEARSQLAEPDEAVAVVGDAAARADVAAAVSAAVERFGRLDVLVANAGIGEVSPFLELSDGAWDAMLGVNLRGVFLAGQEGARAMIATAGGGANVVIASTNAFFPERDTVHYSTAKGGAVALVRAAALDLAPHGVRINAVSPGLIRTPLAAPLTENPELASAYLEGVPLKRFGEPREIADIVAFLASDEASYITGQNVVVDGGATLGTTFELPDIGGGG